MELQRRRSIAGRGAHAALHRPDGTLVAGLERCLVRYRPLQMILSYAEELMRDVIAPLMDLSLSIMAKKKSALSGDNR